MSRGSGFNLGLRLHYFQQMSQERQTGCMGHARHLRSHLRDIVRRVTFA